jgi:hypothetical protein
MIIGPDQADKLIRDTFGFGAQKPAPVPSEDEKKVRMPKTSADLQRWLKRAGRGK